MLKSFGLQWCLRIPRKFRPPRSCRTCRLAMQREWRSFAKQFRRLEREVYRWILTPAAKRWRLPMQSRERIQWRAKSWRRDSSRCRPRSQFHSASHSRRYSPWSARWCRECRRCSSWNRVHCPARMWRQFQSQPTKLRRTTKSTEKQRKDVRKEKLMNHRSDVYQKRRDGSR